MFLKKSVNLQEMSMNVDYSYTGQPLMSRIPAMDLPGNFAFFALIGL